MPQLLLFSPPNFQFNQNWQWINKIWKSIFLTFVCCGCCRPIDFYSLKKSTNDSMYFQECRTTTQNVLLLLLFTNNTCISNILNTYLWKWLWFRRINVISCENNMLTVWKTIQRWVHPLTLKIYQHVTGSRHRAGTSLDFMRKRSSS